MNKKLQLVFFLLLIVCTTVVLFLVSRNGTFAVLNPQGWVATKERNLILTAAALMSIVVIPVLILTFVFAWKYREGNTGEQYTPDWADNTTLEAIWWGIPCLIILILATITWTSAHQLDPFKPLNSSAKPLTIQVIALQWKWLFIYPEQDIATVNFFQFPANTPVNFQITSDAPMNSFWIPQLGGQVYAMSGMTTQLHLMANAPGSYSGSSANLSGKGFSGMKFTAKSSSQNDFEAWVQSVKKSPDALTTQEYATLAAPSEESPIRYYSWLNKKLYANTVMKFMMPSTDSTDNHTSIPASPSAEPMDMPAMR